MFGVEQAWDANYVKRITFKITNMSKPKKGYKRWTVDIKEKTAKKAQMIAIKQDSTPKEICQQILEEHFNGKV